MKLELLLRRNKQIRTVGFDDAPWRQLEHGESVGFVGSICSAVRFEGMLTGSFTKDGNDITDKLSECLLSSKFLPQLHWILLDGITFGGCNIVDLPLLAKRTGLPAVTVMRKLPDMEKFKELLNRFSDPIQRWEVVQKAGKVHQYKHFCFQVIGEDPEFVGPALERLTDQGKVPEPLRLSHLIGSAMVTGQSGNRA